MEIAPTDWRVRARVLVCRTIVCSCGREHIAPEPRRFFYLENRVNPAKAVVAPAEDIPALIPMPSNLEVMHRHLRESVPACHLCLPERPGEPGAFYLPPEPKSARDAYTVDGQDVLELF